MIASGKVMWRASARNSDTGTSPNDCRNANNIPAAIPGMRQRQGDEDERTERSRAEGASALDQRRIEPGQAGENGADAIGECDHHMRQPAGGPRRG